MDIVFEGRRTINNAAKSSSGGPRQPTRPATFRLRVGSGMPVTVWVGAAGQSASERGQTLVVGYSCIGYAAIIAESLDLLSSKRIDMTHTRAPLPTNGFDPIQCIQHPPNPNPINRQTGRPKAPMAALTRRSMPRCLALLSPLLLLGQLWLMSPRCCWAFHYYLVEEKYCHLALEPGVGVRIMSKPVQPSPISNPIVVRSMWWLHRGGEGSILYTITPRHAV